MMVKGKDIAKFSDLQGKKVAAAGKTDTQIMQALGVAPVGTPAPEVAVSMEKKVVDGTFRPWNDTPTDRGSW